MLKRRFNSEVNNRKKKSKLYYDEDLKQQEEEEIKDVEMTEDIHIALPPITRTTINATELAETLSTYFTEINLSDIVYGYLGSPFISTWRTDNPNEEITLPFNQTLSNEEQETLSELKFFVEWGDGTVDANILSHRYTEPNQYIVQIYGQIYNFAFGKSNLYCMKLLDVSQWGCVNLAPDGYQFAGCGNLNITAGDQPNLSHISHMKRMFWLCSTLNTDLLNQWDTSHVVDMSGMFEGATMFNGDISGWDTNQGKPCNSDKPNKPNNPDNPYNSDNPG